MTGSSLGCWSWFGWGRVLDSAVIAGAGCNGLTVTTILVGVAKMAAERGKGLGCIIFAAPFTACDVEHSGSIDDVVSDADDRGFTRCVVAGSCESDSDVELSEEGLNGCRWIPWCLHTELVFI